jgi:hypothetical protein
MEQTPQDHDALRRRKNEALLFALALLAFAWFQHPALHDNALTRLDLTYSIVLRQSLRIDPYHDNTMDKALRHGHYYCDKAPGLSFAAAPALLLIRTVFRTLDFYPENPLIAWMLIVITVAIPCALACMLLFRLLRREAGGAAAACAVVFTALGTLFFIYSGLFYSHAPAAALLVFALYLVATPWQQGAAPSSRALLGCGLLIGCATATEYTAAIPGLAVAGIAMHAAGARRALPWLVLGGLAPALGLAAYNNAAFGSPFSIGYFHEADPYFSKEMARGIGGVSWPRPQALAAILASPTRGLLWTAPVLLFAIPGCVWGVKQGHRARALCMAGAFGFGAMLIVNAGYYEPFGGHTPGPRLLVCALPLLAAPLAFAWQRLSALGKIAFLGFGFASFFSNLALAAGEPHAPLVFTNPLAQFIWPLMKQGYFSGSLADMFNLPPMISLALIAILISFGLGLLIRKSAQPPPIISLLCGAAAGMALFALLTAAGGISGGPGDQARPEYARAWARRGYQAYHAGLYRDMERSLLRAVDNDPYYMQPYVSLGAFYIYKAGRPDLARPLLQNAETAARTSGDPLLPVIVDLKKAAAPPKGDDT